MRKKKVKKEKVLNYLRNINHQYDGLYKSNCNKEILLKSNSFITDELNNYLKGILNSLDDCIYYFKYAIYNKNIVVPGYNFYKKEKLINFINFIEVSNYPYDTFGIRFEFIDTESNRLIYIIIIE